MYIIGTAGHVDHGKTLLIKALTGIDADRLPEEKKRGLTIDLGFAHFTGTGGSRIGVVDVPGHERFIRNMTAGAWGMDLALLVIAADDGWMPQTENHLKVLLAMGIRNIIITVTKTDLAAPSRVKEVQDFAEELVSEKVGKKVSSIAVSAQTGDRIAELKELIQTNLNSQASASASQAETPLLYIDRVFSIKGAGLVVTGSLREGSISRGDSLTLLPVNKEIRVRGIQLHDKAAETALPSARTAVNITGVSIDEVNRGCCITGRKTGFTAEHEAIIFLQTGRKEIRNHSEAEFASGTAHSIGVIHFLGDSLCARITLEKETALRFGQPVVIIRKGGSRITGSGTVIWKGATGRDERIKIADASRELTLPLTAAHRFIFDIMVSGWTDTGSAASAAEAAGDQATAIGRWLLGTDFLKTAGEKILKLASETGGVKTDELTSELKLPKQMISGICAELANSKKIRHSSGTWFAAASSPEKLPPEAEKVLKEAEKAGKLGLDLVKVRIPGVHKQLRMLTRAGLIVPLTENIYYTEQVFIGVCRSILRGFSIDNTFDIAHVKERTGLSRKYIIPILIKMEELGFVVREDNLRRVRKLL